MIVRLFMYFSFFRIQALIEREWIQAGHPFATRHRYGCYAPSQSRPKTAGASFLLFLDCIYQLHYQFPCSFEFCSQLLIDLFEHSYCSQYGTFLCDSEKERVAAQVYRRTTSLWSYLNRPEILDTLLNPLYDPNPNVIWPSVAPISIEVWNGECFCKLFIGFGVYYSIFIELYLRWQIDQTNAKENRERIKALVTQEKELRSVVSRCSRKKYSVSRASDNW